VLSTPTGNLVVHAGRTESFVTGVQSPALVAEARRLLKDLHAPTVRFAIAMPHDSALAYGDGGWGRDGAVTVTHENIRYTWRRQAPQASTASASRSLPLAPVLPAVGFSEALQMYLADEEVHAVRRDPGYSDADFIVHFEKSNIMCLGGLFTADGYPAIDSTHGGTLAGLIKTADYFVKYLNESARYVPGRGPVTTKDELRAYLAMLTTVRDRIQPLVIAGRTRQQVLEAKPTADFDARWGHGAISPDAFVAMVHASLVRASRAAAPPAVPAKP
jgi:hypothetical protein